MKFISPKLMNCIYLNLDVSDFISPYVFTKLQEITYFAKTLKFMQKIRMSRDVRNNWQR